LSYHCAANLLSAWFILGRSPERPSDMFFISKLKQFLDRTNAMPLVLGIMAGAAVNRTFIAFLDDVFHPIFSHAFGLHYWRSAEFILSQTAGTVGSVSMNTIKFGHFGGMLLDLAITAGVVLVAARWLRKKPQPAAARTTSPCPNCGTAIHSVQSSLPNQLDYSADWNAHASGKTTQQPLPANHRSA